MKIEEEKKIAHVRHCKKFKSWATDGKEGYIISNNDIIYNDSVNPQREGLGDDEEADDFVDPGEGGGGCLREAQRQLC